MSDLPDGRCLTTYQRADGEDISDFSWVTGTEWFESDDEPTAMVRRRWVLVEEVSGTYWPSCHALCPNCGGEGSVVNGDDQIECATCYGSGRHPLDGAGFVQEIDATHRCRLADCPTCLADHGKTDP